MEKPKMRRVQPQRKQENKKPCLMKSIYHASSVVPVSLLVPSRGIYIYTYIYLLSSPEDIFALIFRQSRRERERKKHQCERDTSTGCHPHDPNQDRGQTATEVHALSGNRTHVSLVRGPML
uniref:Uncharacterized protein n=1 Tax=Molossus molossus TaxID=27622 RepID=A0A7J8EE71_MOLMO|nr:hypothetical protein HJG59_008881 [Molossus molossus]